MKNRQRKDIVRGTLLGSGNPNDDWPHVVCVGFDTNTGNCLLLQIGKGNSQCPEQPISLDAKSLRESKWIVEGFRDLDERPVGVP